jgi:hypothetical protein
LHVSQVNLSCFGFFQCFFFFHHLTLDYWVLRFLIFLCFSFLKGYPGLQVC